MHFKKALVDVEIGKTINGKYINNIRYADENVLNAETIANMQNILDWVNIASEAMELAINLQETEVMAINKTDENCYIYLNNNQLEQVHNFS